MVTNAVCENALCMKKNKRSQSANQSQKSTLKRYDSAFDVLFSVYELKY